MSYNKKTWKSGDVITSEGLNHLEEGVESAQLISVTSSDIGKILSVVNGQNGPVYALINNRFEIEFRNNRGNITTDTTIDEIKDAYLAGRILYANYNGLHLPLTFLSLYDDILDDIRFSYWYDDSGEEIAYKVDEGWNFSEV